MDRILKEVVEREGPNDNDTKVRPGELIFYCPGCKCHHWVHTPEAEGNGPKWSFNGSFEKPTFSPSILVRSSEMTEKGWADYEKWIKGDKSSEHSKFESRDTCCHMFIRDGHIEFLGDCTHSLAGKTVPMEPF